MVDSAKMAIYLYPGKILADHLSIKSHLRDAPRDTHGATADYDDTALGTGTLTVHPWRAGPDCGKFIVCTNLKNRFYLRMEIYVLLIDFLNLSPLIE